MPTIYKRSKAAYIIQAICIVLSAFLLFTYLHFGWSQDSGGLISTLGLAFAYTFPLIFVEGLYGMRSAMLSYTLILIPTVVMSPGDAFLLTFHLIMIMITEFCINHGFFKSLPKTLICGLISGCILNSVFFFVNHLVAEEAFSNVFGNVDYYGMADILIQVIIAYVILYLQFNFLPESKTKIYPVGRFKNHIKNKEYEEYLKRTPKRSLGKQIIQILAIEALVLGFFSALVTNSLIPGLGEVVETQGPGVSGGAVMFKPARKPDSTSASSDAETSNTESSVKVPIDIPAAVSRSAARPSEEQIKIHEEHIRERVDWYMSRTRLGAFDSDDDGTTEIFVLNAEGLAFDIKLILFLFNIVMPIVILLHYFLERRMISPIAGMSLAMSEFATDSLEQRKAAAAQITSRTLKTKDEVQVLHESLAATVDEVIDYIERLQEEQQLREDLRVAQKASEAKSNFLSNVSHEIRTPINAVLGMDEMILRESKDPAIRKYANDIMVSGRTLVSLINDLLDFSRIEAGKLEIIPVEYEMSSALNDLVNMISIKAEEKNLKFDIDVDETMPHLLIGDEIRVKQCIINILNNAVKYTQKGSVKMSVSYDKKDDKHIILNISVADTGIGIKKEDLSSLFTPFERIEENKNRTIEGTGLGMSIVKNLLDMMDSSLHVESTYGEGSTFSFSVVQEVVSWEPMGDFAEMYERSLESTKEYHTAFQAPDAKILVVDDTKMNLTVIRGLLTPTRIDITTALSGQEAIDKVSNTHFDMIFLDQRMPGLDGIETLQYMKKNLPEKIEGVPIIALTANAISGARERFIKAGFDDYLTKPIDSVKLENTIAAHLPKNLVIHPEDEGYEDVSEDASATTDKTPQDEMLKKYSQFDEISYDDAIANCLKEEILSEAINDFYAASKTGPDEIEKYLTEKDLKNYTVKVHALKSSARLIGAMDISKQAAFLEKCGDDQKISEISDLTPKLLSDYRAFSDKLKALLDEIKGSDDDLPEIDSAGLSEAYAGIKEYVDAFDFDSADSILEMLKGYRIPDEEKTKYEQICDMIMKLDHDGLMEVL